jgi:hypothetical protein
MAAVEWNGSFVFDISETVTLVQMEREGESALSETKNWCLFVYLALGFVNVEVVFLCITGNGRSF